MKQKEKAAPEGRFFARFDFQLQLELSPERREAATAASATMIGA
jgi:hypothetical protein